ncbi:MAG: hypothetical protein Q4C87_11140 [Actinomycetaceae bacterium]|nr:hypothetical protein [Actinomycetaceae bacterium]
MNSRNARLGMTAGLMATWLIYLSDVLIGIGAPFGSGFWLGMSELPRWRIDLPGYALFLFPLVAISLYVFAIGLKARWLGVAGVWMLTTICVFLHSSYFYFAAVSRRFAQHPSVEMKAILDEFSQVKDIPMMLYFSGMSILLIVVVVLILRGKTIYPWWLVFLTPITGIVLSTAIKAIDLRLYGLLQPVLIPAFWFALMLTVGMVYIRKNYVEVMPPRDGAT